MTTIVTQLGLPESPPSCLLAGFSFNFLSLQGPGATFYGKKAPSMSQLSRHSGLALPFTRSLLAHSFTPILSSFLSLSLPPHSLSVSHNHIFIHQTSLIRLSRGKIQDRDEGGAAHRLGWQVN